MPALCLSMALLIVMRSLFVKHFSQVLGSCVFIGPYFSELKMTTLNKVNEISGDFRHADETLCNEYIGLIHLLFPFCNMPLPLSIPRRRSQ